jgi:hypothetical protein
MKIFDTDCAQVFGTLIYRESVVWRDFSTRGSGEKYEKKIRVSKA